MPGRAVNAVVAVAAPAAAAVAVVGALARVAAVPAPRSAEHQRRGQPDQQPLGPHPRPPALTDRAAGATGAGAGSDIDREGES